MNNLSSTVENCMGALKFRIRVPSKEPEKEVSGIREIEVIVHMTGDDLGRFEEENLTLKGTIKDCKLSMEALQKTKDDLRVLLGERKIDTFTSEEATIKGREIILRAKQKAKELREIAMSEAMAVESKISRLRAIKKLMEERAEQTH